MSELPRFALNRDVRISYTDSESETASVLPPLVICPGLSETAEEYASLQSALLPRRTVALSFRGRGGSDTPEQGYDLRQHAEDIACVVQAAKLTRFHLFAYSRGVSYALAYAERHGGSLVSLMLQDYPPEHKAMSAEWAESYLRGYLIPSGRTNRIRPIAVYGIQRDSTPYRFERPISVPLLVARGMQEGSLIDDSEMARYRRLSPMLVEKRFHLSGHDIRAREERALFGALADFMAQAERTSS